MSTDKNPVFTQDSFDASFIDTPAIPSL
jgi:hypothetical protein